jgi:hypothetical protein
MASLSAAAAHVFLSTTRFKELVDIGAITRQAPGKYDLDVVRRETFAHLRAERGGHGTALKHWPPSPVMVRASLCKALGAGKWQPVTGSNRPVSPVSRASLALPLISPPAAKLVCFPVVIGPVMISPSAPDCVGWVTVDQPPAAYLGMVWPQTR